MSDHAIYFDLKTLNWKEAFKLCFVDDNWPYRLEEKIQQETTKKNLLENNNKKIPGGGRTVGRSCFVVQTPPPS